MGHVLQQTIGHTKGEEVQEVTYPDTKFPSLNSSKDDMMPQDTSTDRTDVKIMPNIPPEDSENGKVFPLRTGKGNHLLDLCLRFKH